jgi:EF-hand domain pair
MKKLLIGAATAMFAAATLAVAQPAPPPPPGVAQGTAPAPLPPQMAPEMHKRMMSNRTITRDEAVRHVRELFARLDTNRDGFVTRDELEAVHQKMMAMRQDGAPGAPGMRMHMHHAGMGMGGHLFEMADTNHDGRVSLQEAEAAALAHFDRADLNHDGKLTPDERRQAHERMRAEHRPG